MKHLDGNALCSVSNSVLSFTRQLLRASRRGKRKLIIVSCKSLTNQQICHWFTNITADAEWKDVWFKDTMWWYAVLNVVFATKPCYTLFICFVFLFFIYLFIDRRFSIQPVCGDLQSQVLKCYRENTGKTLTCSSIASAYMQCVDDAKKVRVNLNSSYHASLVIVKFPHIFGAI